MTELRHVLFLVEAFPPPRNAWGGVQVTIRCQADGLARDGRLTVLAPARLVLPLARYREERQIRGRESDPGRAHAEPAAIRVLRPSYLHFPLIWWITEPVQLFILGLWAALRHARGASVFHGHRAYPMGLLAVLLGMCLRRPSVVSVYGSDVHSDAVTGAAASRFWIRLALRRAGRVVAVSRSLVDRIAGLGVGADRACLVPSGVDLERFAPREASGARARLGLPARGAVLLCNSQFLPVKGHAVLVEAFRRLCRRRDDVLLVLTGDGPSRPPIEAAVRAGGLEGRVCFPGIVDFDAIPLWVAAAHALVLPSFNEGMPLCVLEAFACGKPVVATAVGGTPELVSEPRYGILVPPGDADALAAALESCLERSWDPAALRGRAAAFGWPRVVDRLRALYGELAPGAARR